MWIKNVFYALLAFSFVFIGLMLVQSDLSTTYNVTIADNESASYNKVAESMTIVRNMSDTMYNANYEGESSFYLMTKEVIQVTRMFFKLPEIIINILNYLGEKIGIPSWIIGILIVAIIVTITIYIIGIFAKVPWGS